MALSDADLRGIAAHREPRALLHHEVVKFARAIEAEVRKQDEALILQLVEALGEDEKIEWAVACATNAARSQAKEGGA